MSDVDKYREILDEYNRLKSEGDIEGKEYLNLVGRALDLLSKKIDY